MTYYVSSGTLNLTKPKPLVGGNLPCFSRPVFSRATGALHVVKRGICYEQVRPSVTLVSCT